MIVQTHHHRFETLAMSTSNRYEMLAGCILHKATPTRVLVGPRNLHRQKLHRIPRASARMKTRTKCPGSALCVDTNWYKGEGRHFYPPPPQRISRGIFGINIPPHPPSQEGSGWGMGWSTLQNQDNCSRLLFAPTLRNPDWLLGNRFFFLTPYRQHRSGNKWRGGE